MKTSIYNHYIDIGSKVLCYNAFTNSFVLTTSQLKTKVENFSKDSDVALLKQFIDNGFIVEDDVDELNDYLNSVLRHRFDTTSYMVGINPTIDCNLNCWYCYEKHIPSKANKETVENTLKHIAVQYEKQRFRHLTFAFFGGEPLLYVDVVESVISGIKQMSNEYGFSVSFGFTTNATLVDEKLLNILEYENVTFQITLDGNEINHNRVRKLKSDGSGTYRKILDSMSLILTKIPGASIRVRINVSNKNVDGLNDIIDDISQMPNNKKLMFTVHKVWQEVGKGIDEQKILNFVSKCQKTGLKCLYTNLELKCDGCYADNLNQAVINYDGLVYKCTARDFVVENSCGRLLSNGEIRWNTQLLLKRLSLTLPKVCLECNLLPSCPKHCSQSLLEHPEQGCMLDNNYTKEDYIIQTFNNSLIDYKSTKK